MKFIQGKTQKTVWSYEQATQRGSSGGAVVEDPPASAGDPRRLRFGPSREDPPEQGMAPPLQYSCLENSDAQRNLGRL